MVCKRDSLARTLGIVAHRRENHVANVEEIKDKAKGVVIDQIDRRSTDLGNVVGSHVGNLRSMGDSLRGQGQEGTARLVDMAADRLNQVSTYLTQTDGDRIVHDIENVARTQPLITAAAGLVFGVTAARLLKAGASHRYRTYGSGSTYGSTGYGTSSGYGTGSTGDTSDYATRGYDTSPTSETNYGVR